MLLVKFLSVKGIKISRWLLNSLLRTSRWRLWSVPLLLRSWSCSHSRFPCMNEESPPLFW